MRLLDAPIAQRKRSAEDNKMLENPIAPHNLIESCDALFNLTVHIRQHTKNPSGVHDDFVKYAGKLEDTVLAFGQEIYQQSDLNQFYRDMGLDGADTFVDQIETSMNKTRTTIKTLMEWADRLCEAYVDQRPFEKYRTSDDVIDKNCRQAYIWVVTQSDMHCGYDVKDLIFTRQHT
jgi:hypothetical protein